MGTTPIYALPYGSLADQPDGATQTQALATAVEGKFVTVDAAINAAPIGGEWRATSQQTGLVTASNKLVLGTSVVAANGITFNGTDTWTIQTSGVYKMFANIRVTATGVGGALSISGTSYSDASLLFPGTSVTSVWGDFSHAASGYLTAGTQLCVWWYNNGSTTTANFASRPAMFKIWKDK